MRAVLDVYDDAGRLLSEPDVLGSLPGSIKTASLPTMEELDAMPDDLFALVIDRTGQPPLRKFACVDGPSTFVSALYLGHTYRTLTPDGVKLAARNLSEAARMYGVELPALVGELEKTGGLEVLREPEEVKVAEQHRSCVEDTIEALREARKERRMQKKEGDLTGTEAMPVGVTKPSRAAAKKLASQGNRIRLGGLTVEELEPAPRTLERFCQVKEGSGSVYPLDNLADIMELERTFRSNVTKIAVEDRPTLAEALAERERSIGLTPGDTVLKYAGDSYQPETQLLRAFDARKTAAWRRRLDHEVYDRLLADRPDDAREFAAKLAAADIALGMDDEWDRGLVDPWAAVLSSTKQADIIYNRNGVFVSDNQVKRLAEREPRKVLGAVLDPDIVEEFIRDPVTVFNSLPDPVKQAVGRLANDTVWRGDAR